jgi:polar amino acid transport system substrate-binding protein
MRWTGLATLLVAASAGAQAPGEGELVDAGPVEAGVEATADAGPPPVVLEAPPLPTEPLTLAVVGNPPFHIRADGDGEAEGLSVDIWEAVADELGLAYRFETYPNASAAVDAVARGEVDGAIGPISINSARARRVSFTQPYWQASLSILAREESSLWESVRPFVSEAFVTGVVVLLTILTLVGTLLWALERGPNDQFPKGVVAGIGTGVWLALVTMTTVGYGDKAPVTLAGRVVTGVWMLVAMLTASSLTAGIATALTLVSLQRGAIETDAELANEVVAALEGTTSYDFGRRNGARMVGVRSVDEAVDRLLEENVAAVVYDRPILQYHLRERDGASLRLSPFEYEPVGYGFVFPLGSPLTARIDVLLLEMAESGRLARFGDEWL